MKAQRPILFVRHLRIMETRFKKIGDIINILMNTTAAMLSVGVIIYGAIYFGLDDKYAQLGLIEHVFYIACLVMIWMYFFEIRITTKQFNYWCTLCLGATVLFRDILFPFELANHSIQLCVHTLSVLLLCMLTYFYARKDWKSYTKRDLWMVFIVDLLIAALYNIDMYYEVQDEYTNFILVSIWTRPTITYGLVACYILEGDEEE